MARGNDGNYLQHSVEVALARHLTSNAAGLHACLTHGMAPYEVCETPTVQRKMLLNALSSAANAPNSAESPVVTAYRATKATLSNYPNSGELLAAVVGRKNLHGGITELHAAKYACLQTAWKGFAFKPVHASWRSQLAYGGVHSCPSRLDMPWFFSMDPMTYIEAGTTDDDKLHRSDVPQIVVALSGFVQSGQPGVATIFVYAVRKDDRQAFWNFADEMASLTKLTAESLWLPHNGGNRNLAVVLTSHCLPHDWPPLGVRRGRS